MVKIFGVERNQCEYKNCKEKPTHIIQTGIQQGINTWVYCKPHAKKQAKKIGVKNGSTHWTKQHEKQTIDNKKVKLTIEVEQWQYQENQNKYQKHSGKK